MEPILTDRVQNLINTFAQQDVYIHLETTNGSYASHIAGAFIRNALIQFEHGKIVGDGPFRVGLKLELGWIYAEGLTHYELDNDGRLLLAGHGPDGYLAVALQLSKTPFT